MLYIPGVFKPVILDVAKETGSVVRWEACSSDMFRQGPADEVEGGSKKG
jgi:hypothetical protein